MRPRPAVRRGLSALTATLLAATAAGCGNGAPEATPATPAATVASASPAPAVDARVALAALAALSEDRRYTAVYTLDVPGRAERQVVATTATDGSWRVDIPGGALGGTADVAIAQIEAGVFQCSLPAPGSGTASTCVKVADNDERVPAKYDPGIQRVLHNWPAVLTDRNAALSVSTAQPLPGVRGSCFSVDSISASLRAPLDVGIYCYAADGLLTGARTELGQLRLAGTPSGAPPSVDLPGPVVAGRPLRMDAQPEPTGGDSPTTPGPA